MNRSLSIGGLSLALSLGACDGGPPEHTTDFYRQHLDAAKIRAEVCDQMAITVRDTDCLNANEALAFEAEHGTPKFRSLFDEKN